ncbi:MAG: DMT family transporter [Eggerthellaceae bacterium]
MDQTRGTLLLLCSAMVWGMAFAAQTVASDHIGPFSFIAGKAVCATAALGTVLLVRRRLHPQPSASELAVSSLSGGRKSLFVAGICCGIVLYSADILQQAGITAYPPDEAVSGRSGFLTATYVVMTALMMPLLGKKQHAVVFAAAFLCLVGLYFLCLANGIQGIYLGDALCLGGAAFYTAHLIFVDRFKRIDSISLTFAQFLVCAVIAVPVALVVEHPAPEMFLDSILPVLYVGVVSSGLGYTFQAMGQRHADPGVAAIVMSLESVFAALAGCLFLGEVLTARELLGCVLMFSAVILAQVPEMQKSSRT